MDDIAPLGDYRSVRQRMTIVADVAIIEIDLIGADGSVLRHGHVIYVHSGLKSAIG
jgi:hypothetical protein